MEALRYDDIVHVDIIESIKQLREQIIYNEIFQRYIYRGHSKSDSFKLVPSLLRIEGDSLKEKRKDFYTKELRSLLQFYLESNQHGLYVPHIPSFFQFGISSEFDFSLILQDREWAWLSNDVIELAALAQHYGLHTRLLDWTRDIRVALYFAALGVDNTQNEDMAIWCIDAGNLMARGDAFDTSHHIADLLSYDGQGDHWEKRELIRILNTDVLPLRFFVPRYESNKNISAQKGILSIWQYNLGQKEIFQHSANRKNIRDIPSKNNITPESVEKLRRDIEKNIYEFLEQSIERDTEPLDKLLLDYFDQKKSKREMIRSRQNKVLHKVVIKKELKEELLHMLHADGVDRAQIYPGYQSIAAMIMNHEI